MEKKDIIKKISEFIESLNNIKNKLDIDSKEIRDKELDKITSNPGFFFLFVTAEV